MPPSSIAEEQFRRWLARRGSGCAFAGTLAGTETLMAFYQPLAAIEADEIADFLDLCGATQRVAVVLLPRVRGEGDLVDAISRVITHPRWQAMFDPTMSRDAGEVGIKMIWTTSSGQTTNAMGFYPSPYMPSTRHAPHAAIAAWTGAHENPFRRGSSPEMVTMGDASPRARNKSQYDKSMEWTRSTSKRMIAGDVGVPVLRNLAFRISADAAASLAHLVRAPIA